MHAPLLISFHSKVCPLRAAAFLSEPGDCDRLAKWHTYTDTHLWTHAEAQTEGRLVLLGRDQTAPDSSYKTLPGWGQCPAPSWTVPPYSVPGRVRTGSRRATNMNDIYKAAVCPLTSHTAESVQLASSDEVILVCWMLTKNLCGLNLVWEWGCFWITNHNP